MERENLILTVVVIALVIISSYAFYLQQFYVTGRNSLAGEEIGELLLTYENGSSTTVNAYVAANSEEQELGLMNQSSMGNCNGLGDCYGMLFLWQAYSDKCFWMKNTVMPLKQFWITGNLITAEYNGTPYSTYTYCSYSDSVLETNTNSSLKVGESVTLESIAKS